MTQIGSIYVTVKGDSTQFQKDMTALRSTAKKSGKDVSDALNNAIKPGQAAKGISDISVNLSQLAKSAKVPAENFKVTAKAISDGMGHVAKTIGMTDKEFARLNERMLRNQAYKSAENSLRNIARSADLSQKEIKALAMQMGYSSKEAQKMAGSISRVSKETDRWRSSLKNLAIALVPLVSAGAVIRGVQNISREFLAVADASVKTADKLGLAVESLQQYRYAADLTGVSQATLDMALQRFTRRTAEAAQGSGELVKVFEQYNIQTKDASGNIRDTEDVLADLADVIKNASSDSERLRIAFKAFDSEGVALVNTLRKGSEGLEDFRKEAERLGFIIDEKTARQAERINDQITRLRLMVTGMSNDIQKELMPSVESIVNYMVLWIDENREFLKTSIVDTVRSTAKATKEVYDITKDVWELWNQIPEYVRGPAGMGLLGWALFGKPGLIAGVAASFGMSLKDIYSKIKEKFPDEIGPKIYRGKPPSELPEKNLLIDSLDGVQTAIDETSGLNNAIKSLQNEWAKLNLTAREYEKLEVEQWYKAQKEIVGDLVPELEKLRDVKLALIESEGMTDSFLVRQEEMIAANERAKKILDDRIRDRIEAEERFNKEVVENRLAAERKLSDEIERIQDQALRDIQSQNASVIRDMLDGSLREWKNYGDAIVDIMKNTLANVLAMFMQQKIILPIFTAVIGGGGAMAGQAMSGNFLGGLFSSSGALGMKLHPGLGSSSIASTLGAAGLGSLGYSALGDMLGLPTGGYSGIGSFLGSGAGYLGGAALGAKLGGTLGSFAPGIGTVIGALAGGLLGSLFGGKSTPPKHRTRSTWTGSGATYAGIGGGATVAEAEQLASPIFSVLDTAYSAIGQLGGTLNDFAMTVNTSFRRVARVYLDDEKFEAKKFEDLPWEEISAIAFKKMILAAEFESDLINKAVKKIDFSTVESALGDLNWLYNFNDAIRGFKSGIEETKISIDNLVKAEFDALIKGLEEFRDTAKRLGMDMKEVTQAQKEYAKGIVLGRDSMTDTERMLYELEAKYKGYIEVLKSVGYTVEEAEKIAAQGHKKELARIAEEEKQRAAAITATYKSQIAQLYANIKDVHQRIREEIERNLAMITESRRNFMLGEFGPYAPEQRREVGRGMVRNLALAASQGDDQAIRAFLSAQEDFLGTSRSTRTSYTDYLKDVAYSLRQYGKVETGVRKSPNQDLIDEIEDLKKQINDIGVYLAKHTSDSANYLKKLYYLEVQNG